MEQKEEMKQIVEEEQIPIEKDENKQQQETDKKDDHGDLEASEEEKIVTVLNKVAEAGKSDEEENQKESTSKSVNQGSKTSIKVKATVPRPFCLATEKRILSRERRSSVDFSPLTEKKSMPKERRSSVEFKDSQPKVLIKSISLNYKTQSSLGPGFGETSKPKHANSAVATTKINSKIVASASYQRSDKKMETDMKNKHKIRVIKEVESRYLQLTAKNQQGQEQDKDNKLRKSSTFKASPLPSFYNRKSPAPKPETNKILPTLPSPVLGLRSKSMANGSKLKLEEKGKTVSRAKSTFDAKETISKLFKSTKRTLIGSKETVKGGVVAVA